MQSKFFERKQLCFASFHLYPGELEVHGGKLEFKIVIILRSADLNTKNNSICEPNEDQNHGVLLQVDVTVT